MRKFITLLLILASCQTYSQTKLPSDVIEEINRRIEYGINPSIAIGIVNKEGYQFYSFGTKQLNGEKVNEHTIYEIGSITKTFTGTLLALAILKGEMNAEDPAQNYLEKLTLPTRGDEVIRLGNLTDHTSSLPRMPDNFSPADPLNPYADYTIEDMYEFLESVELSRDIGSQYEYSNLAQGLLGHILSLKAGKSYEDLVQTRILKPLNMIESSITFTDGMIKNLALPYSNSVEVKNWDIPTLAGAGAIRSSTSDMLKYLEANLGLKESDLYSAMQLAHTPRHNKAGLMQVGFGWHIKPEEEGNIIWHNGGTGGYRAFAGFVSESKSGVVVLTNSNVSIDDIGFHLLNENNTLNVTKKPVTQIIRQSIDEKGIEQALEDFNRIKIENSDDYVFSEASINRLGYDYLEKNIEAALAIFKLNIEEYPNSSNVYDSYGEALMKNGQNDLAIENYKRSLELNPGNANAIDMLKKLGVDMDENVMVSEEVLETYVGDYQLAPGFIISITREENRLFAQATNQAKFEIYPITETEFFYKVVEAQIRFNTSDGEVESLTLFQNGREVPGMRMSE